MVHTHPYIFFSLLSLYWMSSGMGRELEVGPQYRIRDPFQGPSQSLARGPPGCNRKALPVMSRRSSEALQPQRQHRRH